VPWASLCLQLRLIFLQSLTLFGWGDKQADAAIDKLSKNLKYLQTKAVYPQGPDDPIQDIENEQ